MRKHRMVLANIDKDPVHGHFANLEYTLHMQNIIFYYCGRIVKKNYAIFIMVIQKSGSSGGQEIKNVKQDSCRKRVLLAFKFL